MISTLTVLFSACQPQKVIDNASVADKMDLLTGQWESDCFVTDPSESIILNLTFEKVDSVTFHNRSKMSSYDQNNCSGNLTVTDVNSQPLPVSGIPPVTDINTVQTSLSGMPDQYILVSNQVLDANGDPDGAPYYQVMTAECNNLYVLLIGSNVVGNSWDDWKTSSAVVAQFASDPNVAANDGNGTVILKLSRP